MTSRADLESFLPGSHKTARVSSRFVRDPSGRGTTFEPVPGVEPDNEDWDARDDWKPEPCTPGTLVLIHGGSASPLRPAQTHVLMHRERDAPVPAEPFRQVEGDLHVSHDRRRRGVYL